MAVDDVYVLALKASQNAQQIVNTFAMRMKGATEPTASDWTVLAGQIRDVLLPYQVDDLVYTDWSALKVRGTGVTYNTTAPFRVSTVSYAGAFSGSNVGVLTSPPGNMATAIVFSLTTALSGRRYKGRFYLGGQPSTAVNIDGTVDNTVRANMQTNIADQLVTALGPSGTIALAQLGVWSDRIATNTVLSNTWPRVRVTAGTPDPTNAWSAVTAIICRDYVGSQRDRRPGI